MSGESQTIVWYRSKIDTWIAFMLCIPPVASVAVCVALVLDRKTHELPIAIASCILVIGIYIGLVFPMRYGVSHTHLVVRFGRCRKRIPLTDIQHVYPTHNPLSSPALSLDRLYVRYGGRFFQAVMISPANRDRFLNELAERAKLKRDGDQLIRS